MKLGPAGKLAHFFINSKLTPLVIITSLMLGFWAVYSLPREEEPQIIVPMIDIFVQMPGASAKEVEQRITKPMEKLLWEIPGVEYIYSTSMPGRSMAIVRFYVGENEENAIVRLNQKMFANFDLIPPGASPPLIKPRYIDDVPILALTLWSEKYNSYELRRMAAQMEDLVKSVRDVSATNIIGGEKRKLKVLTDPYKLAAYSVDPVFLMRTLQQSNTQYLAGELTKNNREVIIEGLGFFRDSKEVQNLVIGVNQGKPVYLRDVAQIIDGPDEPVDYVSFGLGAAAGEKGLTAPENGRQQFPAVTLDIAKRKGKNAITVAEGVLQKIEENREKLLPREVNMTITRNYGETAAEKSNELLWHMLIAILSVTALVWLVLGRRESGVVLTAIPVTLALTLAVFNFIGYTLNRITLFALIFSIGILVDDAIVVVENIVRHFRMESNRGKPLWEVAVSAVDEVGNPTILATFAVIAAILPMAYVGGLMGPYMRPIPVGASAAMIFSLLVAFLVTPWASLRLLRSEATSEPSGKKDGSPEGSGIPELNPQSAIRNPKSEEDLATRLYRKVMWALIHNKWWQGLFLAGIVMLLLAAFSLVFIKFVAVKMLPFDNKSEFQVIIDMPEGTSLEQTYALTDDIGKYIRQAREVTDYQLYVGTSAPFNFNGLVRHYFLRRGANVADIQVNLTPKNKRKEQSHEIAKRLRPGIKEIGDRYGAAIKVAEVPPGPPVLETLVAEVYGPDYKKQIELAARIKEIFAATEGVVDVDWYVEADQPKLTVTPDKEKAALNGITTEQIDAALRFAVSGLPAGLLHLENEREDLPIVLRLPREWRSNWKNLLELQLSGNNGSRVTLAELVKINHTVQEKNIYHKNLLPVVYVIGDVAGHDESPIYPILKMKKAIAELQIPEGYKIDQLTADLPHDNLKYAMKWDGEWHITYEVFRDLGMAFAAVMVLIYILVVAWFHSFKIPIVIMAAIPFSLVGILPAHGLLGAFFTATSMIGFIAGAGIVVRNSIILVDFIELRLAEGMPLDEAVVDAGAVRFRPMMLTAAAVVVGASVILFDPIFQGLAISLMAGEVASLFLSRMSVPILYFLAERNKHFKEISVKAI